MSPETKHVRHFVSEPGVCSTMISSALVGPVMNMMKVIMFYFVRVSVFFLLRPLTPDT